MAKKPFTNKLVREAIADADAVRESAIANAKMQLEETFTPAIKALIAKRLKSEADADMKLEDEMKRAISGDAAEIPGQEVDDFAAVGGTGLPSELDSSNIGSVDNKLPSDDARDSSDIGDLGAAKNFEASAGEPSDDEFGGAPAPQDGEEPAANPFDDMGGDAGEEGGDDGEGEEDDDEYDDFDLDLETIIKELEDDIAALRNASLGGEEDGEPTVDGDDEEEEGMEKEQAVVESVPNKSSDISGPDNKAPAEFASSGIGASRPDNAGKEFTGSDLENKGSAATTYEGQEGAAPSPDPTKASSADTEETHAGQNFMKEGSAEKIDEELDLKEILEELEVSTYEQMASEIASLQTENAEFKRAVKVLGGKLNEVNLLNAKLLFTNKLFRNTGLTNEQKVRIVENFDRATTVREVKLVYTALAESVSVKRRKPSSKSVTVNEGFASKASVTQTPKEQAEVITEVSGVAKRFQLLAGLLKEEK